MENCLLLAGKEPEGCQVLYSIKQPISGVHMDIMKSPSVKAEGSSP